MCGYVRCNPPKKMLVNKRRAGPKCCIHIASFFGAMIREPGGDTAKRSSNMLSQDNHGWLWNLIHYQRFILHSWLPLNYRPFFFNTYHRDTHDQTIPLSFHTLKGRVGIQTWWSTFTGTCGVGWWWWGGEQTNQVCRRVSHHDCFQVPGASQHHERCTRRSWPRDYAARAA